jgi:hypothetical protein
MASKGLQPRLLDRPSRDAAGLEPLLSGRLLSESRRDARLVAAVLVTAIGTALVVLAHSLS